MHGEWKSEKLKWAQILIYWFDRCTGNQSRNSGLMARVRSGLRQTQHEVGLEVAWLIRPPCCCLRRRITERSPTNFVASSEIKGAAGGIGYGCCSSQSPDEDDCRFEEKREREIGQRCSPSILSDVVGDGGHVHSGDWRGKNEKKREKDILIFF